MPTMLCKITSPFDQQGKTEVRRALLKRPGVRTVDIDMDTKTMRIRYVTPATQYDIIRCIEQAGFSVARL